MFWEHASGTPVAPDEEPQRITLAIDDDGDDGDGPDEAPPGDDPTIELRFSATEVLRQKDFAEYTPDELVEAQELMARLRLVGSPRRSLRLARADRRTDRPDLRRTVRAAMRSGGEPVRRHYHEPSTRSRRLVLLLDVSGSMEPYARALIRFVHAAVAGRQKVEAFALGTRLTRITRELSSRDPDEALRRAATRVVDYGGGTRLGEGMRAFNDEWGQRGMARGAVVVILSDGWDRGEPTVLAEQMERLHRAAHKVVWVNPLKVTPGYAPLARGMAAALPHVDAFVEGHSIEAIEHLAREISEP
ncbi:MAG: vWA domain-containing protein [Acidimicrobiia bacterium]